MDGHPRISVLTWELLRHFGEGIARGHEAFDSILERTQDSKVSSERSVVSPRDPGKAKPIALEEYQFPDSFQRGVPCTVLLLGAGSSKPLGFPVCRDIFSEAYFNYVAQTGCFERQDRELQKEFANRGPEFEELLSKARSEDEALYLRLLSYYERLFLSAESISGMAEFHGDGKGWLEKSFHYFIFLAYVLFLAESGRSPVVLSFNHDLNIENHIGWRRFNYGSITTTMFNKALYPSFPRFETDFSLLKLHGSFNFLGCRCCGRIWCASDYLWDKASWVDCMLCGASSFAPIYVPPLRTKDYSTMASSWEDAKFYLQNAEELQVFGYSLPNYDLNALELLGNLNSQADVFVSDLNASRTVANYSFLSNKRYYSSQSFDDFMYGVYAVGFPHSTFMYAGRGC